MSHVLRHRLASSLAFCAITLATSAAFAGIIADENAKPGLSGSWTARDDGTARFDGVVDVYPARWSIARGDAIKLKVRSTQAYDVRVMRLGWYGGAGATEVKVVTGQPASPQPYPTADAKYGLAEAKWTDSVTIPTDATWTPGLYVARVETTGGKDAVTFFVIRDDGLPAKLPVLLVVGLATHQAYNAWPGDARGGKSLYGFNSSPVHPTDAIGTLNQAVRVSYDRPFLVGGGTADIGGYEYPFVRFLEKNGWDVAYATDVDLHEHPEVATGRRVITFSGHEEYTTGKMFDTALAARDAGTNFLFLSGDTWSWQVRLETGSGGPLSTQIGYKENFVKDPEQKAGFNAKTAGKIDEAITHFKLVTRGWKNLEQDSTTTPPIDVRRPGMMLTGVQSAGVIRTKDGSPSNGGLYPWADLVVVYPSFWIFEGTGLAGGDKIPNVFGYEVDSTLAATPDLDKFRPAPPVVLGRIVEVSDGAVKGSAAFYRHASGAEVVAMGAIYTSWALDDWAAKGSGFAGSTDTRYQKMVLNALTRWTGATPPPPPPPPPDGGIFDAGGEPDADPVEKDAGAPGDTASDPDDALPGTDGAPGNGANGGSTSGCGCTTAGGDETATYGSLLALAAVIAAGARRRLKAKVA